MLQTPNGWANRERNGLGEHGLELSPFRRSFRSSASAHCEGRAIASNADSHRASRFLCLRMFPHLDRRANADHP
jgi:hypothetical protein